MKTLLKPLASLRITIVLLVLAMILIYAGTWAQVDTGIWMVQKKYFHCFFTWIDFQTLFPRPKPGEARIPGGFPMLGGYSIIAIMLVNLVAAHTVRFKLNAKRIGIILIHLGLILLLVGELLTSTLAIESRMVIDNGQTVNYSEDTRAAELAVIDPSAPDSDTVVAFQQGQLKTGAVLNHPILPFQISLDEYDGNSEILGPMQDHSGLISKATAGAGKGIFLANLPKVSGTEAQDIDTASAYATITANGQNLGTFLLSCYMDDPQEIAVNGHLYQISLRFERYYKPYTVRLIKFSHDKYLGSDTPRNFSSLIQLVDPSHGVNRQVLIKMNSPLRYGGETFYQASFKPDDKTTILQVVKNPAWTMPYLACALGAMGMLIHFGTMLVSFLRRRANRPASQRPIRQRYPIADFAFPAIALIAGVVMVGTAIFPPAAPKAGDFDMASFAQLPVMFDGRLMPMDTLARTSLDIMLSRDSTRLGPATDKYDQWQPVPAVNWLADVMCGSPNASKYRVFDIENLDLLGFLGLDQDRDPHFYSFEELASSQEKLEGQIALIRNVSPKDRDLFQRKVADLYERVQLFLRLNRLDDIYIVPPERADSSWQTIAQVEPVLEKDQANSQPAARALFGLLSDYHDNQPAEFNAELLRYRAQLQKNFPTQLAATEYETFFNRFDPFYLAIILYVIVFVLSALSWLGWSRPIGRAAMVLLTIGFILHTFGLVSRIYISGRPPVTNLYSSAIFIAWAGVLLAGLLELVYRKGVAVAVAATMGFASLLIAHHLALGGDTMKQMQAVLDTNFWLATHVICISLGTSSTFLSGVLGLAFILLGVFTPLLRGSAQASDDSLDKILPRMVYAIVCFAMLFSFVGTILGGIWADQSWGRFWGWDPKENGAALIVLWNALILHARWSGIAKRIGIMQLAVFGSVVTSWSWFGTNMLGVGLHSYGFMDSALFWLLMFVVSQIAVVAIGFIPVQYWRSFRPLPMARPAAIAAAQA